MAGCLAPEGGCCSRRSGAQVGAWPPLPPRRERRRSGARGAVGARAGRGSVRGFQPQGAVGLKGRSMGGAGLVPGLASGGRSRYQGTSRLSSEGSDSLPPPPLGAWGVVAELQRYPGSQPFA